VGRSRYFYTLTFTYDFQHEDDSVFFAYCYPYTYSELTEELTALERDAPRPNSSAATSSAEPSLATNASTSPSLTRTTLM
jgi:hypothetical protein